MYTNDLPDVITDSQTKLFVDDSLLFAEVNRSSDQAKLQRDLNASQTWEKDWQMDFNPSKCAVMNIRNSHTKAPTRQYTLHDQLLETTKTSDPLRRHDLD